MSYKDLPLDQRMELASQYALLLVADDKPTWEIIGILKKDYALTEEQAAQAVSVMRTNYKNEYNSTVRSNFFKALGILGFSLFAFLCYYFMGKEMGSAGSLSFLFAILFGIGGVGALFVIGRIIVERLSKPAKAKKTQSRAPGRPDQFTNNLNGLAVMCGILLIITAYLYFFRVDIIDETNITTIHNCIITEPVRYESTSGKNRRYYYVLKLRGSNLEYRFFNKYYKYSSGPWRVAELKQWDTVSIQVQNEDLDRLRNQYSTGELDIVNLGRYSRLLVDHGKRNVLIKNNQERNFYVLLAVFGCLIFVMVFKNLWR